MNRNQIEKFKQILPQLQAFHSEFEALTKKEANGAINAFKLKIVNQIIDDVNKVLGSELLPIRGFAKFDDDALPSNSDVSMVLAQYLEAMEVLRAKNIERSARGVWHWAVQGAEYDSIMETTPPRYMKNIK